MHIKQLIIILFSLAFLFGYGCHRPDHNPVISTDSLGFATAMLLSEKMVKKSGITTDSAHLKSNTRLLHCSGYILTENENDVSVPSPADGKIVKLYAARGYMIHPGSPVAMIENSDFIVLQQEYLESKNQYEFFKEEYVRQGDLTVENATSIKKMQIAKRDYQSAELKFKSLALQLKLLGISPDSINAAKLIPAIPLYSPTKGKVSDLLVHEGKYIRKGDPLFTLSLGSEETLIRLYVPEEAFPSIHKGKMISCALTFDTLNKFEAVVRSIASSVNPENRKFTILANLNGSDTGIIPGMSVHGTIPVNAHPVYSVLSESIVNSSSGKFIFAKNNNRYHKIQVETGIVSGARTTVTGLMPEMADSVVISGMQKLAALYNLQ